MKQGWFKEIADSEGKAFAELKLGELVRLGLPVKLEGSLTEVSGVAEMLG